CCPNNRSLVARLPARISGCRMILPPTNYRHRRQSCIRSSGPGRMSNGGNPPYRRLTLPETPFATPPAKGVSFYPCFCHHLLIWTIRDITNKTPDGFCSVRRFVFNRDTSARCRVGYGCPASVI